MNQEASCRLGHALQESLSDQLTRSTVQRQLGIVQEVLWDWEHPEALADLVAFMAGDLNVFQGRLAEGKKGGQFYTPAHVVKTLVAVLAPHKGGIYDPCCGSGGMFVQSDKFIQAHGGRRATPLPGGWQ